MKTIVYPDGSLEQTIRADEYVSDGKARYANEAEIQSYERQFAEDDARMAEPCRHGQPTNGYCWECQEAIRS